MNHYIEITIIPNAEISPHYIWSKLYAQVHLALVEIKDTNEQVAVGVSFPEYQVSEKNGIVFGWIGTKLRLFAADVVTLERLDLNQWLTRLSDYVHQSSMREVPATATPIQVNRYRPPASMGNLARRMAKRKGCSVEDALAYYQTLKQDKKDLPFIMLQSLGGQQSFSLCIEQKPCEQIMQGAFNTYGLSGKATVPNWA